MPVVTSIHTPDYCRKWGILNLLQYLTKVCPVLALIKPSSLPTTHTCPLYRTVGRHRAVGRALAPVSKGTPSTLHWRSAKRPVRPKQQREYSHSCARLQGIGNSLLRGRQHLLAPPPALGCSDQRNTNKQHSWCKGTTRRTPSHHAESSHKTLCFRL